MSTQIDSMTLQMTINGKPCSFHIVAGDRLSHVLRREGFLGVKVGCYTGDCGTCTVLLDGQPILACVMLAAQAEGANLTTIEGLAQGPKLHPIQEAFLDHGAIQCGFCSPAMILSAKALLDQTTVPSESEAREILSATLCRCTGYERPVAAILDAAQRMREASE